MIRFTNVLFSPLGRKDNPAALRRVDTLVRANDSAVTVLGVISEPSPLQRLVHRPGLVDQIVECEKVELASKVERWASGIQSTNAEALVTVGSPALAIIDRVLAVGHDLVVVTTDEDSTDHATIKRLMRKCPCPVLVIRPTRARIQRVLAAVNPSEEEAALNRDVLEIAASMHELNGGELHIAHAWELFGENTLRTSPFLHTPEGEVRELIREEHALHEHALTELMTGIDAPWTVHLDKGPPVDVLVALVRRLRINVLVMGTVARVGLQGLVMGNTAERVLDEVKCSVIAVKPPGFVSPVRRQT